MTTPPAPEGVTITRNGETIPVKVEFEGVRELDIGTVNVFKIVGAKVFPGDQLQIGMMPGKTSLAFEAPEGFGEPS